jgi:Staphylococcal nuclease homologue
VVSGDCLVVNDAAAGAERRVFLSSIRAPRIGRREEKSEPYAAEAKEFLRNRLIGETAFTPDVHANFTASSLCCIIATSRRAQLRVASTFLGTRSSAQFS